MKMNVSFRIIGLVATRVRTRGARELASSWSGMSYSARLISYASSDPGGSKNYYGCIVHRPLRDSIRVSSSTY